MRTPILTSMLLLILFMSGCSKSELVETREAESSPYPGYKVWLIKKDNHYSENNSYAKFNGSLIRFKTIFDSSAIYTSINPSNQSDIHKLYGTSDMGTHHHENSARFGWRWNGQHVEIHAYYYVNKERRSMFLGEAEIGKEYNYALSVDGSSYVFQFNNKTTTVERYSNAPSFDGYLLYPYFGGDETAPHDIRIHINNLK